MQEQRDHSKEMELNMCRARDTRVADPMRTALVKAPEMVMMGPM